jgi:Uma2 family endonuclease
MSAQTPGLRLPDQFGYTVADLHALPEDGRRYELIDGSLIVSPSATIDHNLVARWIADVLDETKPPEFVTGTDQSANVDDHNEPRPDVVVAHIRNLRTSPFPITDASLVVEVVSPSSVLRDTETKRALYARAGVPSYWIVVPEQDKPTIALAELALDPGQRQYRYATHYTTDMFRTDRPWPVEIDLPGLTARRAGLMRLAGVAEAEEGQEPSRAL